MKCFGTILEKLHDFKVPEVVKKYRKLVEPFQI